MSATPERSAVAPQPALAVRLIGLLLLLAPLPAGSHRLWAEHSLALYACATAGIAVALWWRQRPTTSLDRLQTTTLLLWLLWLCWIAVQLLALPPGWLERWAPENVSLYAKAAATLGTPVTARLSLAPADTAWMLMLSSVYALIFLLVLLFARTPAARRWLLLCLIVGAAMQSVFGVAMVASGLELGPFGPKQHYLGSATGTFVNRNHFAGYLQIGGALAAAMILARLPRREPGQRWRLLLRDLIDSLLSRNTIVRLALLVIIVGLIASQSRMGTASFLTSISAGTVLFLSLRGRGRWLRGLLFLLLVIAFDVLLLGSGFGLDELIERFDYESLGGDLRLSTFADLVEVIRHHGLLGSGLGTFAYVYPRFRSETVYAFNDHAHNDYAQFLIETGVPGTALLGALVLLAALRGLAVIRKRHDPDTVGVALGGLLVLISLGLHSLTDFNLQIPANAVAVVVVLALLVGLSPRRRHRDRAADDAGSAAGRSEA